MKLFALTLFFAVSEALLAQEKFSFNENANRFKGHRTSVGDLAYSSDGSILATVGGKNQAIVFNAATGDIIAKSQEYDKPMNWIALSEDQSLMAMGSWGKADVVILDPKTCNEINRIPMESVFMLDFSPTSNDLAILGIKGEKQTIAIYDPKTGTKKKEIFNQGGEKTFPTAVEFSPNGKFIACGISNANQGIRIWDAATGELSLTIHHPDDITDIDFSPDGKTISGGGTDKNVYIWDALSGKKLHTLMGYDGYVSTVNISPDGTKIVAAGMGRGHRFMMWDTKSGALLQDVAGRGADVNCLRFSPDGLSMAMALQTYGDAFDVATVLIYRSGAAVEASSWHIMSANNSSVEFPKEPTIETKEDSYYAYTDVSLTDGYYVYGYYGTKYKFNTDANKQTAAERKRADYYKNGAEKIQEATFKIGAEEGIDLIYYNGSARYHYRIIFLDNTLHQWNFSARNEESCPEEERIINSFKYGSAGSNINYSKPKSGSNPFKVGDRVEGNWKGQGKWYPGKIGKIAGGKYYIQYDDGDVEWVDTARIRRK